MERSRGASGTGRVVGANAVGQTATYLSISGSKSVSFTFTDALRPGVIETIATLKDKGMDVTLLSGDVPAAVADIAGCVGITDGRLIFCQRVRPNMWHALAKRAKRS